MKFLHPEILYGLFLLAIPVIIHLFHFKKFKPVYFSQIEFLKELKKESNTKNKLKEWLLLLLRVLAIACIVIVFAQPYIPTSKNTIDSSNSISLFIDNSFSSEANNEKGTIVDLEKNIAREIIHSFKETDEFQIISNNFEQKNLKYYTKETALSLIDEIQVSSSSLSSKDLRSIQKNSGKLHANFPVSTFFISDFQKSQFKLEHLKKSHEKKIFLAPVHNQNRKNVSIQSAYLTKPFFRKNQQIDLEVILKNHSSENYEGLNIKLFNNGKVKSSRSISIQSNDSSRVALSFTADDSDFQEIIIQINDSPIGFDNNYHLSLAGKDKLKIAYIYRTKHQYFTKLFKQEEFEFTSFPESQIPYSELGTYDLIILDELLNLKSGFIQALSKSFKEGNSNICIIPSANSDVNTYNQLFLSLNQRITFQNKRTQTLDILKLKFDHPIFQEVFKTENKDINKPTTNHYFPLSENFTQKGASLISLQNGNPFLWSNTENGNFCFVLTTDISTGTNLEQHALFVPTFYNMSFIKEKTQKLQYTLGSEQLIRLKGNNNTEKISLNIADKTYYPTFKQTESGFYIVIDNNLNTEGIYTVLQENKPIAKLGFNYPRRESDLEYFSTDEINTFISENDDSEIQLLDFSKDSFIQKITEQFEGKILWPYFLALSLLFLIFEIALIKIRPYENSNS